MGRMGYAAANLGEREILFGYDRLQQQIEKASFPFISANMVFQDSGKPLLDSSVIQTVEVPRADGKKRKVRVGILGLTRMNPGLSQQAPDGRQIVTSDPVSAARKAVPALRKKSDLVVVLAAMEPDQAKALAGEVPGIDLVLGSFSAIQLTNLEVPGEDPSNPTRMIYAGNQGKKMGEVRVFLEEEGKPATMKTKLVTLGKSVPDDPAVAELVERSRASVNDVHRKEASEPGNEGTRAALEGASYVLSEACRSCHEKAYQVWQESGHARAFRVLEQKHQDYNPECVRCHTTGFRRPTGFVNVNSTPGLKNVQCEACHGPGKNHPEPVAKGYGRAGVDTCLACHTPDNSPSFDPVAYMLKIRHWKTEENPAGAGASRP